MDCVIFIKGFDSGEFENYKVWVFFLFSWVANLFLQSLLFSICCVAEKGNKNAIWILFDHCMLSLLFVILKMIIIFYSFSVFISKVFSVLNPKNCMRTQTPFICWWFKKDFVGTKNNQLSGTETWIFSNQIASIVLVHFSEFGSHHWCPTTKRNIENDCTKKG